MTEEEFRKEFDKLGLMNFTADEFLYRGDSNGGSGPCSGLNDGDIPGHALERLLVLAPAWQAVRTEFGGPIRISSAYRAHGYNRCVGGVSNSQHLQGNAGDGQPTQGGSADDLYEAALAVRASGLFKGGIGAYRHFVHIDVRGANADWDRR